MTKYSIEEVLDRVLTISDSDLSTLIAAIDKVHRGTSVSMTAVAGGTHHSTCLMLADLGWLQKDKAPPIEGLEAIEIFQVVPRYLAELKNFLSDALGRRQHRKMAEIFETFCVPFSNDLLTRVNATGGDHAQVGLLLALTVARTLSHSVDPSNIDKAVDMVADIAKRRLANERPSHLHA